MIKRITTSTFVILILSASSGCNSWPNSPNLSVDQFPFLSEKTKLTPFTTQQPTLGMTYSEFFAFTRKSGYGDPSAVTTKNNQMIYTLPYQRDVYFWFDHNRLTRVTRRRVDDPSSWERNEISPSASILDTPL